MGLQNIPGMNSVINDEGQLIRASNNTLPAQIRDDTTDKNEVSGSNCILISNMFDPKEVDLEQDPTYFIEIKNQVQSVAKEWGKIDHIYVE